MNIMVTNVGSTSFKFKIYGMPEEELKAGGTIERIGDGLSTVSYDLAGFSECDRKEKISSHEEAVELVLNLIAARVKSDPNTSLVEPDAIGFKTVHAGNEFGPVIIDEKLMKKMEEFSDAAPSHNPSYIKAIRCFQSKTPDKPLVAVFETGFHRNIPDYAYIYSTPYEWYEKYGIRKYGFHGASLSFVSGRVRELTGKTPSRMIICHLGGSSSICAVKDGVSVDTSMGFSPQAGIPMNNRIGDIDPFILPFMIKKSGAGFEDLYGQLFSNSGLKGISGLSGDVRDLVSVRDADSRAALALNVFAYSVRKTIGSYAAVLGGVDTLCFSGGIGEKSPFMRKEICRNLEFLGIDLDDEKNENRHVVEKRISKDEAEDVYVIPTNEEIVVARSTYGLIRGA